jgi:tetratricopeptide (TPR) repeat protein
MKRPESNRNPQTDLPSHLFHALCELNGFSEMGMQEDVLKSARALFKLRPMHPAVLSEALSAILIHADQLPRWRAAVEKAYAGMSARLRKFVRSEMLGFYVSVRDWNKASQFIPARPRAAQDLLFTMWTLLNLRRMDEARAIERKSIKLLLKSEDRFETSMLLDALADYYAQTGHWAEAEVCWQLSPPEEPFFDTAACRLVQLQAMQGMRNANLGLSTLAGLEALPDEHALMLPGNQRERFEEIHKELTRYEKALKRVVPEKEFWEFGVTTRTP